MGKKVEALKMVVTRKGWPLEFDTFKQRRYLRKV
jgi:hypothetical protein